MYMIRIEERGKSPEFLFTVLDFNLQDISTRICPKAVLLAERDVALFFDKFERPTQVTIIQQSSPRFYQTVRMVQPLLAKLSPRMIVQDIAGHRLFTANMLPSGMAQLSDETQPGQTSKSETNCGPPLTWTGPPVAGPCQFLVRRRVLAGSVIGNKHTRVCKQRFGVEEQSLLVGWFVERVGEGDEQNSELIQLLAPLTKRARVFAIDLR